MKPRDAKPLTPLRCVRGSVTIFWVRKAVAAGGRTYKEPKAYGLMYFHGYQDLDGHCWELMYIAPSAELGG